MKKAQNQAVTPDKTPVSQPIKFERITTEHGLSINQINVITKDSMGFMWFGTHNGLNRYDGRGFKIYKHNPADPDSLSHNIVNSF
jgi:ligand-binding sensor domain-containing protein